jgi:hypothetical protein
MENENLFFQWKCEVTDWGNDMVGLHLYYDSNENVISGLSDTNAVTSN